MAVIALGLGWLAWYESRQLADLEKTSAVQAKVLADVRRAAQKYKTRLDRIDARRRATAETQGAAAKDQAAANPFQPVDLTPYLLKDPDYNRLHEMRLLHSVVQQYGAGLNELGLPPDKLAKLRGLLADRMEIFSDARAAAVAQDIDPNSPEMQQVQQQSYAEVTDEIKDLVGNDALQKLQLLETASGMRNQIQFQYAADLSAQGVPLTSSQIDALAQAEARQASQPRTATANGAMPSFQQMQNQALLDAAAKTLTPEQLAILQQSVSQNQEFQDAMQRAQAAAEKDLGHPIRSWTVSGP